MSETASGSAHLWLDPGFGASGDMMLGCLVGLGAPLAELVAGLRTLPIDSDWDMTHTTVTRNGLTADRVSVETSESHHHRTWSSIDSMLAAAGSSGNLPAWTVTAARRTFRRLGEVEAKMHDVSIDEVHFHEVGAVDAIIDITGVWLALDLLKRHHGELTIGSGPVGLGQGIVTAAHGLLPIPAPATAAILTGAPITSGGEGETVTPTGAALLTTMTNNWGPLPTGRLAAVSRGAGGRNPEGYPNVISAYLVAPEVNSWREPGTMPQSPAGLHGAPAISRVTTAVLQTNLDDVSGELVAHLISQCLEHGADDAWTYPILMKKGRPAHALEVMCSPAKADQLRDLIMAESGTLGVRRQLLIKDMAPRDTSVVTVDGQAIRVKAGPYRAKPEFDDLESASAVLGRPISDLSQQALRQFYDERTEPDQSD